jgi:hypothetical protein
MDKEKFWTPPCHPKFNKRGGPEWLYYETTHWTLFGSTCQRTPPPPPKKKKKKTAYHLRGVPEYCLPEKKTLSPIFFQKIAHFFLFSVSSYESDSKQMKMNFKKMREVFFHNGMKNENLSHFFHRFHEQGESKPALRPFFQFFIFLLQS